MCTMNWFYNQSPDSRAFFNFFPLYPFNLPNCTFTETKLIKICDSVRVLSPALCDLGILSFFRRNIKEHLKKISNYKQFNITSSCVFLRKFKTY